MGGVAVFDVGKTNVKLSAAQPDGTILESLSAPNIVRDGPPYRHPDILGQETWLVDGLRELGRRHPLDTIVLCAHGSGGVLIGEDGPALPMIDYEQPVPPAVDKTYHRIVGSYRERGSPVMAGGAHLARQMLWQEMCWPDEFAQATAFLATPQYWAWRLSGVRASEVTCLAAESHLWSPANARPTALVAERGWQRLIAPRRGAWEALGQLQPELAARTGLPASTQVLCGIHDSSANFHRYQAAGLTDFTAVSTGTWVVALTDRSTADIDEERLGRTCNADIFGRPVPGMLTMAGREFAAVAGAAAGPASTEGLARIVESRTFALPSFGADDGLFAGTARGGRIEGPLAGDPGIRFTLAMLYAALLTAECVDGLPKAATVVLDGNFVKEPLYGATVAGLLAGRHVAVNRDAYGTASGAALLASHATRTTPAPLAIETPDATALPDLKEYRALWRAAVEPRSVRLERL